MQQKSSIGNGKVEREVRWNIRREGLLKRANEYLELSNKTRMTGCTSLEF